MTVIRRTERVVGKKKAAQRSEGGRTNQSAGRASEGR
jgi:hypothetical protein